MLFNFSSGSLGVAPSYFYIVTAVAFLSSLLVDLVMKRSLVREELVGLSLI
jgi:hypothetical protein